MLRLAILTVAVIVGTASSAEEVFKIQIGKDPQHYSDADLRRRVWELERAVWQLQQRVFQLEAGQAAAPVVGPDSWACTVEAMGETYPGTGGSKAVAGTRAIEACKAARGGDGFFCKNPKCSQ